MFKCNRKKFATLEEAIAYANLLANKTGIFHAVEQVKK
jgi:hypothetical protein